MLPAPKRLGDDEGCAGWRPEQKPRQQVADFGYTGQESRHDGQAAATDQAHVAVPAVPGARLAMVGAEIVFGAREAFLDRAAQAGGTGQFGQRRALRGKDQIIGELLRLLAAAADQVPALEPLVRGLGQADSGPGVEPQAPGAFAGGKRRPASVGRSSAMVSGRSR